MSVRTARSAIVAIALFAVALVVVPGWAIGAQRTGGPSFSFYSAHALADGLTADFVLEGFLPIEDLLGLSSVSSEARLDLGGSRALAALPDPGDLVLTLPGTLSALAGVSGLPDYPAAAAAEHPSTPEDEVVLVPDAGLGAGTLRAAALQDESAASASITNFVDLVGLIPSFSIGSAITTATTRRLSGSSLESVATTAVSDLRLLGGLVRIDQISSSVTTTIDGDVLIADASEVHVTGASVAGTPVGITADGIEAQGQPTALAPIVDLLVAPLVEQGIRIHTTPAEQTVSETTAVARGGTLAIEVDLEVSGYPGTLVVTLGRAVSELSASGLREATPTRIPTGGTGGTSTSPATSAPGGGTTPARGGSSVPATTDVSSRTENPSELAVGRDGEIIVLPPSRVIADWDVEDIYRAMVAGGAFLLAALVLVRRAARNGASNPDLRHLWRW
jgi:hypothetical protein